MKLRNTLFNYTIIVCAILISSNLNANIINVPADYTSIQSAINAASTGDTVLVQPGTYNANLNFNGKAITVGSLFITTNDESYLTSTIINGGGSNSVVKFMSNETSASVLSGFTITNGYAYYGAGIRCSGSSPTLSYLNIENNNGEAGDSYGGGLTCMESSTPNCNNLTFTNNYAQAGGGVWFNSNSDASFTNCVFINNTSNHGGAMHIGYATPTIDYCVFYENDAAFGGAVYVFNYAYPVFTNCTFSANTSTYGGGFYCIDLQGQPTITNCILWDNVCSYNLEIFATSSTFPPIVTYTDVENGTGEYWFGTGCLDTDPLFVDAANNDYHLTDGSPCIDAGDPTSPPDPDGSNADQGAFPNYISFSADFYATPTNVCAGSTVQFTDNSVGSPTAWSWVFEGGTPATSTDQNPTIVYNTAGEYDVTLTITDASYNNTLEKENYIVVSTPVAQANTPVGATQVCGGSQEEYTTDIVSGASSYEWQVSPTEAGVIIGDNTVGTFTADDVWTGDYTIKVRAINGCGDGAWSNDLNCSIGLQPYAYLLSDGGGYCEGGTGIELTLSGSELGVDYELFLESISTGIIISGTGSVISFGNQTEVGIYTCIGTAGVCTENMVGTPYVFTTTIPSGASIPTGPNAICGESTTNYNVASIGGAEDVIWNLTPSEAGIIVGTGNDISIEWDADFIGVAMLTAQGENSCGTGTISDPLEITCSQIPTPVITGQSLVCDEEEEEYETTNNLGNTYSWIVAGGEITNGAGTNHITVLWGEPGTGTVELTETSGIDCTASAEIVNVTIDDCTALDEVIVNSLKVYPNPATSLINIKSEDVIRSVKIVNLLGEIMVSKSVNNNSCRVNTSSLKTGIYMMIVDINHVEYREKLIIE